MLFLPSILLTASPVTSEENHWSRNTVSPNTYRNRNMWEVSKLHCMVEYEMSGNNDSLNKMVEYEMSGNNDSWNKTECGGIE
jgi:hypothetical protein